DFSKAAFGSATGLVAKAASQTTTAIWNLHADAHDFSNSSYLSKQVFAANLAHIGVVFIWLSGMHFHGAYFSNYLDWLQDPSIAPTAQQVSNIANQSVLNPIRVTSGFFNLWLAEGITSTYQLKVIAAFGLIASALCFLGSYFHMHSSTSFTRVLNTKLTSLSTHHLVGLLGLGSLAWAGHLIHISLPVNILLNAGVAVPSPHSLLSSKAVATIVEQLSFSALTSSDGYVWQPLVYSAMHHFALALVLIVGSIFLSTASNPLMSFTVGSSWHLVLGVQLFVTGTASVLYAQMSNAYPVYPYLLTDHPTVVSLFVHHMWIGGFFLVGAFAHLSIGLVRDTLPQSFSVVLTQRDIILGHLTWVVAFLGVHSFGLYVHNDTMQALGRPDDMFSDNAISLLPVFARWSTLTLNSTGSAVSVLGVELSTADFMVTHIHAFTIHTTVLILVKGFLYARSSRLVNDKYKLDFRYPCDGPGRGGTCQISPWDHVFLGLFWMYNSISVVIFHFFWEYQSNLASIKASAGGSIRALASDFELNSINTNGWLRNFLWSGAAQVIQSYGSPLAAYGLTFLASHFVWALSLMFLFSGRGYWQELIESVLWAHHKLYVVPHIQPRALSITSGRAVGLTHYLLGGIGTTWSFFLARIVATA
uniref:Photosystem I PsaA n=1 Tax=Amphidinium carterae TaxID=2961 RepID=UPI002FE4FA80